MTVLFAMHARLLLQNAQGLQLVHVILCLRLYTPPTLNRQDEEMGGPEARYARAYEAKVNPFTEFQQKEMEARVRLCVRV